MWKIQNVLKTVIVMAFMLSLLNVAYAADLTGEYDNNFTLGLKPLWEKNLNESGKVEVESDVLILNGTFLSFFGGDTSNMVDIHTQLSNDYTNFNVTIKYDGNQYSAVNTFFHGVAVWNDTIDGTRDTGFYCYYLFSNTYREGYKLWELGSNTATVDSGSTSGSNDPRWLRIVKDGRNLGCYKSLDGLGFSQVGATQTVATEWERENVGLFGYLDSATTGFRELNFYYFDFESNQSFVNTSKTLYVTAEDAEGSSLNIFNLTLSNGTFFETTNGSINTTVDSATDPLTNFTVRSKGYEPKTYTNWNTSVPLNALLTSYFYVYNPVFPQSSQSFDNKTFIRTANYSLKYRCLDSFSPSTLYLYFNDTLKATHTPTCDYTNRTVTGIFALNSEGDAVIKATLNITNLENKISDNKEVVVDLFDPTILISNLTLINGGFGNYNATVSVKCSDSISSYISYVTTFNEASLFNSNQTSGTTLTSDVSVIDGYNPLRTYCRDPVSQSTILTNTSISIKVLYLIDEIENNLFNLANVTTANVYYDDNSSKFDFKGNNTAKVNFTSAQNTKLRFEFIYEDGTTITRYVDTSLISSEDIRVCVNKKGTTHFEQLILAGSQKPAVLKNVYSDCLVAADYTRFAYQDSYLLKAFTISSNYYLYTFSSGVQSFLSSIDGSIATFINLDQLEFSKNPYNIDVAGDQMTWQKVSAQAIRLYYRNLDADNTYLNLTIKRLDTNAIVLSTDDFTNFNEFNLLYDYSLETGLSNETLFVAELYRESPSGSGTLKEYFNISGTSGFLSAGFALAMALGLLIFGLTLSVTRLTFSWFGIIVILGCIGILSLAVTTWYTLLMQAICVICLVFVGLSMWSQNNQTIS